MGNTSLPLSTNLWASMVLQINAQARQEAQLQAELSCTKQKLKQVKRELAKKDNIIDSLQDDLEHMITQVNRILRQNRSANSGLPAWITRPVPGLNVSREEVLTISTS